MASQNPHLYPEAEADSKERKVKEATSEYQPAKPYNDINWMAPTLMLGSLFAAFAFAAGHHFLYLHFENRKVASVDEQKWIIRGGTGFAFLVKTCLAVATGTAYVQQVWLTLSSKSASISRIDALFSVLRNPIAFAHVRLWFGNPVLTILAVVTWTLPIAAIITPGTLAVEVSLCNFTFNAPPPQLNFSNPSSFARIWSNGKGYWGVSDALSQVAYAAAAQSTILPIEPPISNASYELTFSAPALRCNVPSQDVRMAFKTSLEQQSQYAYGCWTGNASNASLFASSTVNTYYHEKGSDLNFFVPSSVNPDGFNLLECSLMNSTYNVSFDFENSGQTVQVESKEWGDYIPWLNASRNYSVPESYGLSYYGVLQVFFDIVHGSIEVDEIQNQTQIGRYKTLMQFTILEDFVNSEPLPIKVGDFQETIQDLFQNITLSLFSSDPFLLKGNATQDVPVNTSLSTNIYVYRPTDLYLAYGISSFCALACVAIGCVALLRSGLSYTNDFSTILRTTRRPELGALVHSKETAGGAPLPQGFRRIKLRYKPTTSSSDITYGFEVDQQVLERDDPEEGMNAPFLRKQHRDDNEIRGSTLSLAGSLEMQNIEASTRVSYDEELDSRIDLSSGDWPTRTSSLEIGVRSFIDA